MPVLGRGRLADASLRQPEYPLSHVLNLLSAHERFLGEDIQELLDTHGFAHVDAVVRASLASLVPPLNHSDGPTDGLHDAAPARPLRATEAPHPPAARPPADPRAHDLPDARLRWGPPHAELQAARARGRVGRLERGRPRRAGVVRSLARGRARVCVHRPANPSITADEVRNAVFDSRYFTAISAPDAFHIIAEEDFDAGESSSGIRPTNSALRVEELVQQLSGAPAFSLPPGSKLTLARVQTGTAHCQHCTRSRSCSRCTCPSSRRTPSGSPRPSTLSRAFRSASSPARSPTTAQRPPA